jgi:hypothetical protein
MEKTWQLKIQCPVCGAYEFDEEGDYDICPICFWENDGLQNDKPDLFGGANHLSLNCYKEWWTNVDTVLPSLIKKYNIKKIETPASRKFSGLLVPRENVKEFIDEATKNDIELELDFYNICEKYKYNQMTFHGYPFVKANSIEKNNDEIIDILFTKNPIEICKKYNLKQVVELLMQSKDASKFWEDNMPCVGVVANPKRTK